MVVKKVLRQWIEGIKPWVFPIVIRLYTVLKRIFLPLVLKYPNRFRIPLLLKDALKGVVLKKMGVEQGGSGITSVTSLSFLAGSNKAQSADRTRLPQWLIREWEEIHEIEPMTFPSKDLIEHPFFYRIPDSRLVKPYIELGDGVGEEVTHVFLVSRLGSDNIAGLTAGNYILAIHQHYGGKIAVIATGIEDFVLKKQLPIDVRFIDFGRKYGYLSRDEQEKLIARMLLQKAPAVIHVMNSNLGYSLVVKYGEALKTVSNIYASVFSGEKTAEGLRSGYSHTLVPKCFDCLTALICDNMSLLDDLHGVFAFERQKLFVHSLPLSDAMEDSLDPSWTIFFEELANTPGYCIEKAKPMDAIKT